MELRKFYAANMQEALDMVRAELGEDVVILDTRTLREPGAPSEPPVERVEIWAQCAAGVASPPPPASLPAVAKEPVAVPMEAPDTACIEEPNDLAAQMQDLQAQLLNVHSRLELLSDGMGWLGTGSISLSNELVHGIADSLAGKLPVSGGIRCTGAPHVVALIGPTGVGKTTMVAKLAWHFAVTEGRKVGVISADTHRVGAQEQIERYCRHLELPLEILYAPDQAAEALARLADCELVLLDTPGGSQRNAEYLAEVGALLLAADPIEVHLVLNAGASSAVIRDVMQRYAGLHPDQVIFTKLDEAPTPLEVLPLVLGSGLSLSYLGAGQTVATDLTLASPEIISRILTKA